MCAITAAMPSGTGLDKFAVAADEHARRGARAVPDLHRQLRPERGRVDEPVDLARHDTPAEQLVARADHDGTRLGLDRHDEHRLRESTRQSAALPHGVAREAIVLTHHRAIAPYDRSA